MESAGEMQNNSEEKSAISASKKRAENRRKKLLMNSEDRMNRIMGFTGGNKNDGEKIEVDRHVVEPRIHLDLERTEAWSTPVPSKGLPSFPSEVGSGVRHSEGLESKGSPLSGNRDTLGSGVEVEGLELRHRSRGELPADGLSRSPRRGLQQYLSRFDEAFKLRDQLASDKPAQESGSGPEELEAFRLFRLVGSVVLAIVVRMFVCKYLSIFAPFLTLQLAYMGLYKYFPKGEKKMKSTVLTAALLLSGIPAEVINRSMDTYRKMGDVFTDLCVYFFSFIVCHELVLLFGSEIP